jgi:hypothetical protein
MRIRFNEELGTIDIDGVIISASVLRELVNPDRRLLFRFERKDGVIQATAYSEMQILWLDKPLENEENSQTIKFEALNQNSNEER